MLEVIKEIQFKNSDLMIQLLENDEIRILDYELDESINVCFVSELDNLIKALGEFTCKKQS